MYRLQELVRLHRLGVGARQAARELKMGRNTARQYREALDASGLLNGSADAVPELEQLKAAVLAGVPVKPAPQQVSTMAAWEGRVRALMEERLGPTAIFDRLRLDEPDFKASLGSVKRLVARLRRDHGITPEDVAIPVETEPDEIAQVDFGYAGYLWDPADRTLKKAWVFVMVLGYSRHLYAEAVFDQRISTWLALHERAFRALEGVPRVLVPDNLKAAVVRAAFGVANATELNRSYRELARHYGFRVDPTPPRAPKKKGKVESGVKYVKNNFLRARGEQDIRDVNRELQRWTAEIAGQRIHGTTQRRPLDVFSAEERRALLPLPSKPYDLVLWKKATVHADSHVHFERRLYSVPWRLIRREVWIRASATTIAIYFDDERVATHARASAPLRVTNENHLPEGRRDLRHRSQSYWEHRADRIGSDVGQFVREVFSSDDVLLQLRAVQAIVTHLEKFPAERAQAACKRASFYGSYSYQAIKNILSRALDLQPLPAQKPVSTWIDAPAYARDVAVCSNSEGSHERH